MAASVSMILVRRALLLAVVLSLCAGRGAASMARVTTMSSANPIRRVVTMLQDMQTKVEEEGKAEEKIFDDFMCYCKNGGADLQAAIKAAKVKLLQLESDVKEEKAQRAQLQAAIKTAKGDRLVALKSVEEAKAQLDKQNAEYLKEKSELEDYIDAFDHAIEMLSEKVAGSFLQTQTADRLRQLLHTTLMSDANREVLSSFLSGGETVGGIHTVIGILKTMKDDFEEDLKNLKHLNFDVAQDFTSLTSSKNREVAALTSTVQKKSVRFGDVSTELVNDDEDLDDTETGLEEDTHFLADLGMECATKKDEWEKRSKLRSEEVLALGDAIKMLNDDDALELFKKTLPSPSLLQVQASSKEVMRRARRTLGGDHRRDARLDFISLAMRGKNANFDKVISMIDDMVALLKKEQTDDDLKKDNCMKEFDITDDRYKDLRRRRQMAGSSIDKTEEDIASLKEDLAGWKDDILHLDAMVQQATALRKQQHTSNKEDMATNTDSMKLLTAVKARLAEFYDSVAAAASFVQLSSRRASEDDSEDDAPADRPKSFRRYRKKERQTGSVVAMLETLISDLQKEITEAKAEEANAQADYEKFIKDAAEKRNTDKEALESKEAAMAGEQNTQLKNKDEDKDLWKKQMVQASYTKDLHKACDWLVKNHRERLNARVEETESLNQAKAVLSGADISLVQIGSTHRHRAFLA